MLRVFGFLEPKGPVLTGTKTLLRLPKAQDFAQWQTIRLASRAELAQYEPASGQQQLSKPEFALRVKQASVLAKAGQAFQFFIFEKSSLQMLGSLTLGNIKRGASQTGEIGYWLGTSYRKHGYMRDAVSTVIDFSFNTLHLHRIEAACIPSNLRSIALLQFCGFKYEGFARAYLEINGHRQDHNLYARLSSDV